MSWSHRVARTREIIYVMNNGQFSLYVRCIKKKLIMSSLWSLFVPPFELTAIQCDFSLRERITWNWCTIAVLFNTIPLVWLTSLCSSVHQSCEKEQPMNTYGNRLPYNSICGSLVILCFCFLLVDIFCLVSSKTFNLTRSPLCCLMYIIVNCLAKIVTSQGLSCFRKAWFS